MTKLFKITSNIYNPYVLNYLYIETMLLLEVHRLKRSICIFVLVVFATTVFNPQLQKLEFSTSGCGRIRMGKHWCKQASRFHYYSDAFEESCSNIQGCHLSGKH